MTHDDVGFDPATLITVLDAAQFLGLNVHTIRKMAASKRIPSYKIAGKYRFDKTDLRRFVVRTYTGNQEPHNGTVTG